MDKPNEMLCHFLKQLWKGMENTSGSWPVACFVIYTLNELNLWSSANTITLCCSVEDH